jgi:rod shape-determining protein MreC
LSLRDGPFGDIRVPLTWSAAAALVIAAIIAGALLLGDRRETMKAGAYDTARRAVDAVAGPVGGTLSAPVRWTHSGFSFVRGYFDAVSDNRRLRTELTQEQQLRDTVASLQVENQRLRAVLDIRTDPPLPHVAAETIFDSRGPFANTRLANVGRDHGVTEGNPVLSEQGLVGRIVGVSDHVSRVLLLTDAESRTPVLLVRTNGRAILSGDGGGSPKLDYIRSALTLKEGDRVMTSGDGGVFPRGLPVGTVEHSVEGGWRVQLDSDTAPIDYVQILLFTDFAQIADEQALTPKELPTAMTEEPSQSIIAPAATNALAPPGARAAVKPGAQGAKPGADKTTGLAAAKATASSVKPAASAGAKPKPAHPKPVAAAASP